MYGWQELDAAWSAAVTDEGYLMVGDSVGIPCPDSLNVGSYYRQEGPSGEEGVVQTIEYYVRYDTRISNFTGPFIDFDAITAEVFANNSFLPVLLACDDGKGCGWEDYDCPPNLFENATAAIHVGIKEPDCPTRRPTVAPTTAPTSRPTLSTPPTDAPSASPSASPSVMPTASPSESPSAQPSSIPTELPSGVGRANSATVYAIGLVVAGLASFF
uniref:Uncharacterized protein n=1 Tax=Pseudictyota dubia TaxID=2749911 RepID=A0A7R9ZG94_9STRA|mmetsp:Transcript_46386/g.86202  ORF Transcript_46386/g.86202 Transcript_46386/m.86202 type:complete len:215 (+) Transcript_46386:517-1161(+)